MASNQMLSDQDFLESQWDIAQLAIETAQKQFGKIMDPEQPLVGNEKLEMEAGVSDQEFAEQQWLVAEQEIKASDQLRDQEFIQEQWKQGEQIIDQEFLKEQWDQGEAIIHAAESETSTISEQGTAQEGSQDVELDSAAQAIFDEAFRSNIALARTQIFWKQQDQESYNRSVPGLDFAFSTMKTNMIVESSAKIFEDAFKSSLHLARTQIFWTQPEQVSYNQTVKGLYFVSSVTCGDEDTFVDEDIESVVSVQSKVEASGVAYDTFTCYAYDCHQGCYALQCPSKPTGNFSIVNVADIPIPENVPSVKLTEAIPAVDDGGKSIPFSELQCYAYECHESCYSMICPRKTTNTQFIIANVVVDEPAVPVAIVETRETSGELDLLSEITDIVQSIDSYESHTDFKFEPFHAPPFTTQPDTMAEQAESRAEEIDAKVKTIIKEHEHESFFEPEQVLKQEEPVDRTNAQDPTLQPSTPYSPQGPVAESRPLKDMDCNPTSRCSIM